jgi:hypothetical protein
MDSKELRPLKAANLALKFTLELAAIASFAYWGATTGSGALPVLLAIAAPAISGRRLPSAAAMRRAWLPATLTLPVIALVGCGSSVKPIAPVRLTIDGPTDGLRTLGSEVSVSGTVSPPSVTVLVLGQRVAVSSGSFTTRVPVKPGANVLDVIASAPRARGAMSAVRVYRQILVTIPDLSGRSPAQAATELTRLGLAPSVQESGGFFQSLIPTSPQVCQTSPPAGRAVAPGSAVQVQAAKLC